MSSEKHDLQRQADRAKPGSKRSVLSYLVILFGVAFVLLLLSYFMQQRTNELAMDNLQQTSSSAVETLENLIADRDRLNEEVNDLEGQLAQARENLTSANSATETALADARLAETRANALLKLAQLQSLYNQRRYQDARNLIGQYSGLEMQLEEISVNVLSEEGRALYDPLEVYRELVDKLN